MYRTSSALTFTDHHPHLTDVQSSLSIMFEELYQTKKDSEGYGPWYQLILSTGYYYVFKRSDNKFRCECSERPEGHTFTSGRRMELHLSSKNATYLGPEPKHALDVRALVYEDFAGF